MSVIEAERRNLQEDKIRLEQAGKRINQVGYGQEKLIEIEVKRRLDQAVYERLKGHMTKENIDEDEKALRAFVQFKDAYKINYAKVCDEDVLIDAMTEADTNDLKKLLMRYRRLKNEAQLRDPKLANRILKNYFSCIRKVGVLVKKLESSWVGKWDSTFVVLTNAGFIYFKSDQLKDESDLVPRNFKPLNDFVVTVVPPNVSIPLELIQSCCLGMR